MEKFSVLMSVYYKEKPEYLDLSLKSIFDQTIIPNEVVLVEDGQLTNELEKIIKKYERKYPKIMKVIRYKQNRGLGIALHDGLLECSNEIVFRMDSDDYSVHDRFEKQLKVFEEKNVDVVGSNIAEYDEKMENITGYRTIPETNGEIYKFAKKRNPMNHMTVGYKKNTVINSGNYQDMPYFEDYFLWIRMINRKYNFYNLQENLLNVRGGNSMIKRRGGITYIKSIIRFEKALLKIKFINFFEFIINLTERIFFSIIPNAFRSTLYNKVLRK